MANKKIKLDERWIKQLIELPESGMGYQLVRLTLSSGLVLKNRTVVNSEYLLLSESEDYDSSDIVNIELEGQKR